jgi:hypothetical protein
MFLLLKGFQDILPAFKLKCQNVGPAHERQFCRDQRHLFFNSSIFRMKRGSNHPFSLEYDINAIIVGLLDDFEILAIWAGV